jgi:hypothetical protein
VQIVNRPAETAVIARRPPEATALDYIWQQKFGRRRTSAIVRIVLNIADLEISGMAVSKIDNPHLE